MISRLRLHPTILLMAAAHLMVDGYGNIYAPMLPLLIPRLGLSLAAAGTLTMLFQMAASVAQVGFGILADHWRPRTLIMIGPIISVSVLSLIGLATSREMLALILVAGGLGAAAFHPPAAALAHRLGGDRRGLAMSVYITGGTLGSHSVLCVSHRSHSGSDSSGHRCLHCRGLLLSPFSFSACQRFPCIRRPVADSRRFARTQSRSACCTRVWCSEHSRR